MDKQAPPGTSLPHLSHAHAGAILEGCPGAAIASSLQAPVVGAPPRTPPDHASIQSSMDKNKETLKRKLMLRRSVNELVDRGIYPPLKTPPAFAEKTKQLERAKTGDLLRHKIQQRPDRQLLVQQHILEDTTIDPSLHERQRLLKRSRLVDGLNDKLAHRPGPLELVQGNILQPSRELANAIKDGTIQFVPTCDTEDMDQSSSSFMFDDESAGSDGAPSPSMDESSGLSDISSPSSAPPVSFSESLPISFTFTKGIPIPLAVNKNSQISLRCSNSTIISASGATPKAVTGQTGTSSLASTSSSNSSGSGKFRSKKPKPKTASKARIIKFHEYKGPPSVMKTQPSNAPIPTCSSNSAEDTPYHIMLQQQQLFLQWQLEFQQRQHQQGSALSPGATSTVVGDSSPSTPQAMSSIIVTSPVALASSTPSLAQPAVTGNVSLGQTVSVPQPQVSSAPVITQAVISPVPVPALAVAPTASAPTTPAPPAPPPPPLPPTRPTQSVAPRQSTKALTSIPACALSLPKLTGNLEEMKVADLKAELKKRSLPVSGPKPQLIERLKPFTESNSSSLLPSSVVSRSNSSRPPSRVSTPLQFSQTTFHIKTEPNGDVTASPITRPIPSTTATSLLTSSQSVGAYSTNSTFSMPVTLPMRTHGFKAVVSVKPMVKEEPMPATDISPPISPPNLQATTPGTITPMSPDYETTSPPSLTSELKPPMCITSQNLLKPANGTSSSKLIYTSSQNASCMTPGQTIITMTTDAPLPASMVPAELMPMEVDSVSVDLNQGVDDTAFKAASLGQSLDSADFKALIQQPFSNSGYKTISLSHGSLDDKAINLNTNSVDTKAVKTINLNTSFDGTATIKTINISPNTDPSTIKTINLGSNADGSPFKTLSLSQSTDACGFKTINISPVVGDAASLLKTVKVPLTQLSPTHMSPVQLSAPLTHTLTSPTSLLQLQQLQQLHTLQQLQQQLIQQTQAQQQQFQQQQTLQSSPTTTIQLTSNDHVVLAQAKQIEELQRQLQESHLKLKLQQFQQQQHMQLQQQQQQQQQLWQVRIPSNFAQNSLLGKLSQDQQSITPQINQVMAAPLQLQHQQPALVTQQPAASVVQQHQPGSVFFNGHTIQQTPLVVTGVQQTQSQAQQHQAPVMISNQTVVGGSGPSVSAASGVVSMGNTMTSDSNLVTMTTNSSGQTTVSLPYAIHINLTSSGQMKLPSQLHPITTSTSAATTTRSSTVPSLQLPAKLLFNPASTNILAAQPIKSEPNSQHSMGPPMTSSVPKSQVTTGQSLVFTASQSTTILVPGHTNGVISRTSSVPSPSMTIDHQKQDIQRCSSAPYFNAPMKEPPRYDEAIRIKQQQIIPQVHTNNNNNRTTTINSLSKPLSLGQAAPDVLKSQTMDDVLEILIRNGDLPPSAATEALSAPKLPNAGTVPPRHTDVDTSCPTSTSSPLITPSASLVSVTVQSQPAPFPPSATSLTPTNRSTRIHQYDQPRTSSASPRDQTLTSIHTNMFSESLLNDTNTSSLLNTDICGPSTLCLNEGTSNCDNEELLDWGQMIPSPDLTHMDWSVESGFGHLDLGDSNLNLDSKLCDSSHSSQDQDGLPGLESMYATTGGSNLNSHSDNNNSAGLHTPRMHGSEPDLTVLGLGGDSNEAVDPSSQMDMSEWLDVMMPNSGLSMEPINVPTSAPYSADPILTPRTRQEVFDIFDFDDPDFGPSTMCWEKLMEQGTNS